MGVHTRGVFFHQYSSTPMLHCLIALDKSDDFCPLFRNKQVENILNMAGVAKWQTQQTQNLPVATPWGFDSPLRHAYKISVLANVYSGLVCAACRDQSKRVALNTNPGLGDVPRVTGRQLGGRLRQRLPRRESQRRLARPRGPQPGLPPREDSAIGMPSPCRVSSGVVARCCLKRSRGSTGNPSLLIKVGIQCSSSF